MVLSYSGRFSEGTGPAIFGARNSFSKPDHDATFMRMKDDYMQNEQLIASYNVQVATECQYTLTYGVISNPRDTKTLLPFVEQIDKQYVELPKHLYKSK